MRQTLRTAILIAAVFEAIGITLGRLEIDRERIGTS
jgi:hypothetical protein